MLLRGECLIQSVTLSFACHGERGNWRVNVSGPGHIANDSQTEADAPYDLLDAMLKTTFSEVAQKFPGRVSYRNSKLRALHSE